MSPIIYLSGSGRSFSVAVRPYPEDQPTLGRFDSYLAARKQAWRLQFVAGWHIVDVVAGAERKAAED